MLTIKEGYKTMYLFLELYYKKTSSDDIGSLLGCMSFLQNERTADLALWEDWMDAINTLQVKPVKDELSVAEAFEAMRFYFESYQARGSSDDIASILNDMHYSSDRTTVNPETWNIWLQCIDDVQAGKGDFYLRLGCNCCN